MMKAHFEQFAAYNRWANRRLYDEAAKLPDDARKRDVGVFFRSLHGTLNHLLVADYVWMRRLTGDGPQPERLNQILHEDFTALRTARETEDARILDFVGTLSDEDLEGDFAYATLGGTPHRQQRRAVLAHLFNHQTHHRGQAHACLTILGVPEPDPLDLLVFQRGG
jgi:uncharacterized damage-inducible protein DinB